MDVWEASEVLKQRYLSRIPLAEVMDGIILPGPNVTPTSVLSIKDMNLGPDDIVIASAQKSGTMWTAEIVASISHEGDIDTVRSLSHTEKVCWLECDHFGLPEDDVLYAQRFPIQSCKNNIWYTHLPPSRLPTSVLEGKCKLLYVARNPKDQVASHFHFHALNDCLGNQTDLTWDEFFALNWSGHLVYGSWFDHVLEYWKFTRNNPNAKFLVFEDLKTNLAEEVKKIEEFIGINLTDDQRSRVIDHCSFNSMKETTMANENGVHLFNNNLGNFMRKGTVGDWKNYISVAQNEAFDELYKKKMEGYGQRFKFE